MSTENITRFLDRVATDAALQEKVSAAYRASQEATARALSALASEHGLNVTADELLAVQAELSESDLGAVAGGAPQHMVSLRKPRPAGDDVAIIKPPKVVEL